MNLARPELLTAALESVEEAFGVFDADDRLAAFNSRYGMLRSALGGEVALGVPWEDMVTASVRSGAIREAVGREESWLTQRRRTRGDYSIIRQLADGRSFRINERRMTGGGIVVVWTEVTALIPKNPVAEKHRAPGNAAAPRDGSSYDPDDLMTEAQRWRDLAAQAPPVRREIYLSRAAKCETMVVRSLSVPVVAESDGHVRGTPIGAISVGGPMDPARHLARRAAWLRGVGRPAELPEHAERLGQ